MRILRGRTRTPQGRWRRRVGIGSHRATVAVVGLVAVAACLSLGIVLRTVLLNARVPGGPVVLSAPGSTTTAAGTTPTPTPSPSHPVPVTTPATVRPTTPVRPTATATATPSPSVSGTPSFDTGVVPTYEATVPADQLPTGLPRTPPVNDELLVSTQPAATAAVVGQAVTVTVSIAGWIREPWVHVQIEYGDGSVGFDDHSQLPLCTSNAEHGYLETISFTHTYRTPGPYTALVQVGAGCAQGGPIHSWTVPVVIDVLSASGLAPTPTSSPTPTSTSSPTPTATPTGSPT
ncbi:MAG: hypothetical protein ACYCXA_13750, partial [Actinomycetes bacterium]